MWFGGEGGGDEIDGGVTEGGACEGGDRGRQAMVAMGAVAAAEATNRCSLTLRRTLWVAPGGISIPPSAWVVWRLELPHPLSRVSELQRENMLGCTRVCSQVVQVVVWPLTVLLAWLVGGSGQGHAAAARG